jgi:hypothetical protein
MLKSYFLVWKNAKNHPKTLNTLLTSNYLGTNQAILGSSDHAEGTSQPVTISKK